MNWLTDRLKEASTHVSIGVVLTCASIAFPQYQALIAAVAASFGVTGFMIPEKH